MIVNLREFCDWLDEFAAMIRGEAQRKGKVELTADLAEEVALKLERFTGTAEPAGPPPDEEAPSDEPF